MRNYSVAMMNTANMCMMCVMCSSMPADFSDMLSVLGFKDCVK